MAHKNNIKINLPVEDTEEDTFFPYIPSFEPYDKIMEQAEAENNNIISEQEQVSSKDVMQMVFNRKVSQYMAVAVSLFVLTRIIMIVSKWLYTIFGGTI